MFTVRANFSQTFEILASLEKVHDFFSDVKNFVEFMPHIDKIHVDSGGTMHWKIDIVVPLFGSFKEKFLVSEIENSDERIEWKPAKEEKFNLMSYSSDFMPKGKNKTLVNFSQIFELRRRSAADLHSLAGLAGESLISNEMTRKFSEIVNAFIQKARNILEK